MRSFGLGLEKYLHIPIYALSGGEQQIAVGYGNRLMMLHQEQVVLNLSPCEKQALTTRELLKLFYRYEDSTLVQNLLNS